MFIFFLYRRRQTVPQDYATECLPEVTAQRGGIVLLVLPSLTLPVGTTGRSPGVPDSSPGAKDVTWWLRRGRGWQWSEDEVRKGQCAMPKACRRWW